MSDIPEGGEWATAPLLDQSNVGKYVWRSHNGNRPSTAEIVKITRTNIHVEDHYRTKPMSLRVEPRGDLATGNVNGYDESAFTESCRVDKEERGAMIATIRRAHLNDISTADLQRIAAIIKGES